VFSLLSWLQITGARSLRCAVRCLSRVAEGAMRMLKQHNRRSAPQLNHRRQEKSDAAAGVSPRCCVLCLLCLLGTKPDAPFISFNCNPQKSPQPTTATPNHKHKKQATTWPSPSPAPPPAALAPPPPRAAPPPSSPPPSAAPPTPCGRAAASRTTQSAQSTLRGAPEWM